MTANIVRPGTHRPRAESAARHHSFHDALQARPTGSGPGDVLGLIRGGTATTRGEIGAVTGLSRMTVAQRVDALLGAGLIRETGPAEATGGRRASRLVFTTEHATLAVATLDTAHLRIALCDLDGTLLADQSTSTAIESGPKHVLNQVVEGVGRLFGRLHPDLPELTALAISVPGPVDPLNGRPSQPPIMPGWDAFPIIEYLQEALPLPVPVFVENDADAMAFGERTTQYPDSDALCLVKVSTGIGTGLVLGGRLYYGSDGGAGDIGHIRIAGETALCQCGSRGCLAAVASGRAVSRELAERGIAARSGRDVAGLLADGNPDAVALTYDAGRRIGAVMATVVSMLNPGTLVISGDLASSALIGGIRETLYPLTLPRATRNLDVRLGVLGAEAGIIGLARIASDNLYSPAAVNERLAV